MAGEYGPRCRHCDDRKPQQGKRGLCHRCYWTPGVRDRYPSLSKFRPAKLGDWTDEVFDAPPCRVPTPALPGTETKIAVLAERFAAGVDLWHEADGPP